MIELGEQPWCRPNLRPLRRTLRRAHMTRPRCCMSSSLMPALAIRKGMPAVQPSIIVRLARIVREPTSIERRRIIDARAVRRSGWSHWPGSPVSAVPQRMPGFVVSAGLAVATAARAESEAAKRGRPGEVARARPGGPP